MKEDNGLDFRIEKDALGEIKVPANVYWGAVTQRAYQNFEIGQEKMPLGIIRAYAVIKKAAAITNQQLGKLDANRTELIGRVADEIIAGDLDEHFPLPVWQTGSGTQTNMNVNEVIANRGNQIAGEKLLHPNDHVNMSQSSNDTFPTAMHIAAIEAVTEKLLPALERMICRLKRMAEDNQDVLKIGRTHLQDATPISFGQEVSGWAYSLEKDRQMIVTSLEQLTDIALGGTAVGTGLNAPAHYAEEVAEILADLTTYPLTSSINKFHSLSSQDELVWAHGALKALATDLMKMANDVRWLASGPRAGLGEITIPTNEPGSSIMPGKVNPTQAEALTMVAVQVLGNDVTLGVSNSQGNFQLNVYMPVMIYNFLQSVELLTDGILSFHDKCLVGLEINADQMKDNMEQSLMLVTQLSPVIGYEKAAQIAKKAYDENLTLKEASLALDYLTEVEFDRNMEVEKMI